MTSIWEYILELRQKHVYRNNQIKFLSHLAIYTNNLEVYKVVVFADQNKKNGKRYGVNEMIKIHTPETNKNITYPVLKKEIDGSEKGRKIFIYYFGSNSLNCYDGEDY